MSQDLRRGVPRAVLALALFTACGQRCGQCGAVALQADGGDDEAEEAGAKLGGDELSPERCHFEGDPLAIATTSIELGRADSRSVVHLEVGLTSGGVGEILGIGTPGTAEDGGEIVKRLLTSQHTSVGPLAADAPPPRVFSLASGPYALFYPAGGDAGPVKRHLRLVKLEGSPPRVVVLAELPAESLDESLAFDGALRDGPVQGGAFPLPDGLVAWDDDEGDRGVVRAATYQHGTIGAALTVSTSKGDASSPRVLLRDDGYAVLWAVRRSDTQPDGAPKIANGTDIEGPGDLRSFDWIEMARFGLDGTPIGAPLKLTAEGGHVAGFDVVRGAAPNDLDVYARDAAARGKLVHVALRGDAVTETTLDLPSAVGTPQVLRWTNDATLLTYEDGSSRGLLVPLDPKSGEPSARASDEGILDTSTVLWAVAGPSIAGGAMLVTAEGGGGRFRLARCTSAKP